MKKKYFAGVYKSLRQPARDLGDKFYHRMTGKIIGYKIKRGFNQSTFVRGFTLIELLVVIGIIAILASVVIVAINPARQFASARDTQRTANVAAILNGVDENMAEHNGILTCNGVASTLGTNPNFTLIKSGDTNGGDIAPCLVPLYISSLPYDPSSGSYTDSTNYNTDYSIMKDANGHISVMAHSELLPDNGEIVVTR